tara:strand:- start:112 stop:1503 length:1392 start_codon:yes stop_codon:yes gene_type:complete
MKYGTSGFRDKADNIINISYKIGEVLGYLSNSKNKNYGIMITASHNEYKDNGVKIVDYNGCMIQEKEEKIIEDYINNLITLNKTFDIISPKNIYIGDDTRYSSNIIKKNIIDGIRSTSKIINIIYYGNVTTPQHHYLVYNKSLNFNDYIDKYQNINDFKLDFSNLVIDCANGVGYYPLDKLQNLNKLSYKLINICINTYNLLNYEAGTDYIISNNKPPSNFMYDKLSCSLDGDADRFIFYYYDNKLNILDGDYIAILYVKMISKLLTKFKKKYSFGYIHTPYTNKAIINYIKNSNPNISIECTATGVKNLHHKALNYDVSVYFESNGHGTLLVNNIDLQNDIDFIKIDNLNNKVVGDGISGIFCVLYFLKELNMNYKDWFNLVIKNNNFLYKKNVEDRSIYKTNKNGDRLIEPKLLQDKLDNIMDIYNCYCFIRPSGTENVIRIYIESNENLYDIRKEIDDYL